jgi:hypothetical protein
MSRAYGDLRVVRECPRCKTPHAGARSAAALAHAIDDALRIAARQPDADRRAASLEANMRLLHSELAGNCPNCRFSEVASALCVPAPVGCVACRGGIHGCCEGACVCPCSRPG